MGSCFTSKQLVNSYITSSMKPGIFAFFRRCFKRLFDIRVFARHFSASLCRPEQSDENLKVRDQRDFKVMGCSFLDERTIKLERVPLSEIPLL